MQPGFLVRKDEAFSGVITTILLKEIIAPGNIAPFQEMSQRWRKENIFLQTNEDQQTQSMVPLRL